MSDLHNHDRDLDAAEYVLGTLSGEDYRRMTDALASDDELSRRVAEWEHRLGQFGESLSPVEPPAHVWQSIADDLGMSRPTTARDVRTAANDGAMRRWRLTAIAASTAAVLLAGALWLGGPGAPAGDGSATPRFASMVYDKPTGMSWLVHSAGENDKRLAVEALQDYPIPEGKTLRMYIRSASGQSSFVGDLPHSIGEYVMDLTPAARDRLSPDSELVVSMESTEQPGQSPSGPIMWVTPIALRTG